MRRSSRPETVGLEGWSPSTESGLQACYRRAPPCGALLFRALGARVSLSGVILCREVSRRVRDRAEELERGRDAYAKRAWLEAHDALAVVHEREGLAPEDLELLSICAFMPPTNSRQALVESCEDTSMVSALISNTPTLVTSATSVNVEPSVLIAS